MTVASPLVAAGSLASLTTLRLGGTAATVVTATTAEEIAAVARKADADGSPLLLIGGGSNLVSADSGWPGTVLLVRSRGVHAAFDGDDVLVTAAAGEPWDELVARSVTEGWSGLAAMSGIPGLTGATPVQNVGAYGTEVSELIERITVYDRTTATLHEWASAECGFGFRTSRFKHVDRFLVLAVTFRLPRGADLARVRYLELARRLGIGPGESAPSAAVRETVLELRRGKGMVLDVADHDTWSVGSFFVNPVVDRLDARLAEAPRWTVGQHMKLSAAWLIESAGFGKGYGLDRPPHTVAVSTKHTLALTHRGGGTTEQLLGLAAEIRDAVEARFGIRLAPEARLAGCAMPPKSG